MSDRVGVLQQIAAVVALWLVAFILGLEYGKTGVPEWVPFAAWCAFWACWAVTLLSFPRFR